MKFIRKHTEGQWIQRIYNEHMVISPKDHVVVARCGIGEISVYCDSLLISQAPTMLDYIIERAEYIHKILVYNYGYPKETEPKEEYAVMEYRSLKTELSRILEIIKAAGVEVVE